MLQGLLIDNFDSYTYNIFQIIAEISEYEPDIIYNNELFKIEDKLDNLSLYYDYIIISHGPGHPEIDADIGFTKIIFENANIPILGICMGYQLLDTFFNLKKVSNKELVVKFYLNHIKAKVLFISGF